MPRIVPILLGCLALGVSGTVLAGQPGLFFGGGMGYYRIRQDNFFNSTSGLTGSSGEHDFSDEHTAYRAFLGVDFNRYLGIQGSYASFGKASSGGGDIDSHGKGIAAVLSLPLTDSFSVYGKYGRLYWHKHYANGATSRSDDGSDPFYGAGARFLISPALAFRLGYDRYSLNRTHIDLPAASVELHF